MHMLNIGSCGIDCGNCPAYKATQAGDMEKLAELAVKWGGDKGLTAEDVLCDGCISDRVFKNVLDCTVRSCALAKGVEVCSRCGDYACDKLEGLWKGYSLDVDEMKGNLARAR
jgi:hypothetical protein